MNTPAVFPIMFLFSTFCVLSGLAGPFSPAAGLPDSIAVSSSDGRIAGWATKVDAYTAGSSADPMWRDTAQALGRAEGNSFDIVSLGRGGSITLSFGQAITDVAGPDFAVFENAFIDRFLELAFVEVSANGSSFTRFPVQSRTQAPVDTYGTVDPTDVDGFAGKFRQGYGMPFDLADVGLTQITHVRLVDVIGDGRHRDADNRAIFDPFPTFGSAGFDLDGVAILRPSVMENFTMIPGGFTITVPTTVGVANVLEFCTDIELGNWQPFTAPEPGTGLPFTFLAHRSFPMAFYRIRRSPE